MQSLNVLIVGREECLFAEKIKKSKLLNKLYVTSEKTNGAVQIKFNTFKELSQKCKALQIDIVLVEEEKWVLEGIANVMKQNLINCFSVTSNWTNLGLSHSFSRKMLNKYEINIPPIINLPLDFPIFVKGDGILVKANSMQEIISIKEKIFNASPEIAKNLFLEKYLYGSKYKVISLFDGKHLLTFSQPNIKQELLNEYSNKLERMLIMEKANFVGFINSDLIEENGILYNTGFSFEFKMPDLENSPNSDILYICLSAIYQKLNEITL